MRQRLFDERFDGDVVDHITGRIGDAVLAVSGVRIERDVGDDSQLRDCFFHRTHCALRQAFGIPCLFAIVALGLRIRHRKQRERGYAEFGQLLRLSHQFIDADALDVGHAGDSLAT
jgi:hypothetical protein